MHQFHEKITWNAQGADFETKVSGMKIQRVAREDTTNKRKAAGGKQNKLGSRSKAIEKVANDERTTYNEHADGSEREFEIINAIIAAPRHSFLHLFGHHRAHHSLHNFEIDIAQKPEDHCTPEALGLLAVVGLEAALQLVQQRAC